MGAVLGLCSAAQVKKESLSIYNMITKKNVNFSWPVVAAVQLVHYAVLHVHHVAILHQQD